MDSQEEQDRKEQEALKKMTTRQASDPTRLQDTLKKLGPVTRTPEQEKALQEKLDRLQAKVQRIKEQQDKSSDA